MALGQDHLVGIVEQVGQRQVLVEHPGDALGVVDQRQVHLAGAHGLAGLAGLGHDHPELHVRVAAVELRHGPGEQRGAGALERGEPQPPAAQARDRGQLVLGVLDAGEDRVGVGDQRGARLGQPHTACVALQQGGPGLALQGSHLLADRGLGEREGLGRGGEGAAPRDLPEDLQAAYVKH